VAEALLRDVRGSRDDAKAAVLGRLVRGDDPARVAALGREYATRVLPGRLRPALVDKVDWHRAQGHELVIVSASLAVYLVPLAAALGFDHVIAVELEVGEDGRLTGGLVGPNVRGVEKANRLRAWLGDDVPAAVWAYGDSAGDAELLALATTPVWVGRRRRVSRRGGSGR
jgi:HAD superfamily hydrolase (TIGR01490 family)